MDSESVTPDAGKVAPIKRKKSDVSEQGVSNIGEMSIPSFGLHYSLPESSEKREGTPSPEEGKKSKEECTPQSVMKSVSLPVESVPQPVSEKTEIVPQPLPESKQHAPEPKQMEFPINIPSSQDSDLAITGYGVAKDDPYVIDISFDDWSYIFLSSDPPNQVEFSVNENWTFHDSLFGHPDQTSYKKSIRKKAFPRKDWVYPNRPYLCEEITTILDSWIVEYHNNKLPPNEYAYKNGDKLMIENKQMFELIGNDYVAGEV